MFYWPTSVVLLRGFTPIILKGLSSQGLVSRQKVYILMTLKMSKKKSKWYPVAMVNNQNPRKGAKNAFKPAKISQVRQIGQN